MTQSMLTMVILGIVSLLTIIIIIIILRNKKINKFKKQISNLDILKNNIIDIPILSELDKVKSLLKNQKLKRRYDYWHSSFRDIKEKQLPKVTDLILEADYLIDKRNYKKCIEKISCIEIEIHQLKTKANNILKAIKSVTTSDERNRTAITKLKSKYRELTNFFDNRDNSYTPIILPIKEQLCLIDDDFNQFEKLMDINDYDEIVILIKGINTKINNLDDVLKELDDIILLGKTYIPKKIEDISSIYSSMIKEGYILEHLNIEYNVEEIANKMNIIFDRLNNLDTKDSLFELKVFIEYFDNLFRSFDKEKKAKKDFNELLSVFKKKIKRINKIVEHIYTNIDSITNRYNIDNKTLAKLEENKDILSTINYNFKDLVENNINNKLAYSILLKDGLKIKNSVIKIEEELDTTLNSIGNMKEDEKRAKQQLDEIKGLLKKAKFKMRSYKLPVLMDSYLVELTEASESIRNIIKEINKKPIDIDTLNIRVDTGRDLVFKFYKTSNELIKNARMAEETIIFTNRYLHKYPQIESKLAYSNRLFFEGNYKYSLDNTLNILDDIDTSAKEALIEKFKNETTN